MTSVIDLSATVMLAGVSQAGHIRVCKRTANLIEIGQKFEVQLDSSASGLGVGQTALLSEEGTLVLTGRVNQVQFRREPEPHWLVSGRDEFQRAQDWYIDDKDLQATGQSISYWIDYLCNLCGLSYTLTSAGGSETVGTVDVPVPLGLVYVVDDLRQLAGGAGWSMRMTAAGVLEFIALPDSGLADEIITVLNQGNHRTADELVRNVAKVWGYEADNQGLIYKQTVVIPGILPDRNMVVSSPNITTLARAQALAQILLDHFAFIDETADFVVPHGNPSRLLGDILETTIEAGHTQRSVLTDQESVVDPSGYMQSLSIGRKNFWLPTYPPGNLPSPILIVLDSTRRVFYTLDLVNSSPTWIEQSSGLSSGLVIKIGLDRLNGKRAMVLTTTGVWRISDITDPLGSWTHIIDSAAVLVMTGFGSTVTFRSLAVSAYATGIAMFAATVSIPSGAGKGSYTYLFSTADGGFTWAKGDAVFEPSTVFSAVSSITDISIRSIGGTGSIVATTLSGVGACFTSLRDFSGNGALISTTFLSHGSDNSMLVGGWLARAATQKETRVIWPFNTGTFNLAYQLTAISGSGTLSTIATGANTVQARPHAGTVRPDGAISLLAGSDNDLHQMDMGSLAYSDLGSIGLASLKGVQYLSTLILVAIGSGVLESVDGGVSWSTRIGNLASLIAAPDLVSMDWLI